MSLPEACTHAQTQEVSAQEPFFEFHKQGAFSASSSAARLHASRIWRRSRRPAALQIERNAMIDDIREEIEKLLLEAAECEMLGGLAVSHEDRVANRNRAEHLRELASEAQRRLFVREGMRCDRTLCPSSGP
jgi:predicted transcriptional regulator